MSSSSTNRRKTLAGLFLIMTMAIPFAMVYYVSTDTYKARYQQWRKNNEIPNTRKSQAIQNTDQFILTKNQKLEINKIGLEYKGVENKHFLIDLYLLDFDPKQPYPIKIPKKDAKKGFTIADHRFKMLSGNDRFINLKLLESFQTP